ncbi:MAG TPA: transcription-repair coupling factor, partial [Sulfurovum sp.]|nr:transcription-repair coupling factor [Sulfurovum sp.]
MYQSNIYEYLEGLEEDKLLICKDDKEALQIRDVAVLLGFDTFVLPDLRVFVGEDLRAYDEEIQAFLITLATYYESKKKKVLISPVRTLLVAFPKEKYFDKQTIEFGETLSLQTLKETLYHWGYHFTDIAASRGEVSFRGDIIDIFPIDATKPYRISMFDEEVETIQHYDENTQKRLPEELESFTFTASFLALSQEEYESLKLRTEQSKYDTFVKDIDSLGLWHLEELAESALEHFSGVWASSLDDELKEIYELSEPLIPRKSFLLPAIPEGSKYRDLEVVNHNKLLESHKEKEIVIIAKNESIVRGSELDNFENIQFVYQEGIVNILGADRLILSLNKPLKRKKVKKASIILDELKPGDYVVHENYGVGIFKGIEKREVLGSLSEFVVMHYQNEDALLIPVANLEVIDRYMAEGGALPVLDRMGKASFKKLKAKV